MNNQQQFRSIEKIESNYRQAVHGLFNRRMPHPPERAATINAAVDRLLALAVDKGLHITVYEISSHRKSPAGAGWVSLGSRGK
jgi:hypothetical protein